MSITHEAKYIHILPILIKILKTIIEKKIYIVCTCLFYVTKL